jgi:hypothetical protein
MPLRKGFFKKTQKWYLSIEHLEVGIKILALFLQQQPHRDKVLFFFILALFLQQLPHRDVVPCFGCTV